MVTARGLRPIRHNWHMQVDLDGPIDAVPDPPGIEIGVVDTEADLPSVHAVLQSAFAADPFDHLEPYASWLEEHRSSPTHDPTLWLVARDGDAAIGVLTASAGDDDGWVDWLAVLDTHRGRGIGWTLLRRSFAALSARGMRRVLVNVDAENVTGATAVYERAGMRVVNRWDLWERAR